MRFYGIYVPVVTPFLSDGSVDEASYAALLEYLIDAGVHGLVVGGTTGENYALTPDELVRQFAFANEVIGGRVPWVAGVNNIRTEQVCAFAVAARERGASAILLAVPPYSMPNGKELAAHALKVDRTSGLPIILYNFPARSGAEMDHEFLERVGRSSNFVAIKESAGDIGRVHMLAREFPHLQLSCGADDLALEFFAWGAQSWVCAAGNFFAKESLALFEACVVRNDFVTGRRIMKAILPVMELLERSGKFVQCVKYGCDLDGLPAGETVRLPLRPLKKELKRTLRDAIVTARTTLRRIAADTQTKEKASHHG